MKKLYTTLVALLAVVQVSLGQWTTGTDINNTNTGNVGIGLNPNAKLDVWPGASGAAAIRGNAGGSFAVPAFEFTGYNTNSTNGGLTISTNDAGSFSEKMRVQSNGNVGIGTTSPIVPLHVAKTGVNVTGDLTLVSRFTDVAGLKGISLGYNQASQAGIIYSENNSGTGSPLEFWTYNGSSFAPRMIFTQRGFLGIGTIPQTDLDVPGLIRIGSTTAPIAPTSGTAIEQHYDGTHDRGNIFSFDRSNSVWKPLFLDASNLILNTNSSGSVGIGTTTPDPAYKLSVNGTIRSKEIKVNTGWSDYVFNDDYNLRSISEVESYIKKNRHLPDVPSAAEVEKSGVALGETSSLLLKKIEELTLYLIEKDKQLIEQQKINGQQEARLQALEQYIKVK